MELTLKILLDLERATRLLLADATTNETQAPNTLSRNHYYGRRMAYNAVLDEINRRKSTLAKKSCPTCNGRGEVTCPECNGEGHATAPDGVERPCVKAVTCMTCGGSKMVEE